MHEKAQMCSKPLEQTHTVIHNALHSTIISSVCILRTYKLSLCIKYPNAKQLYKACTSKIITKIRCTTKKYMECLFTPSAEAVYTDSAHQCLIQPDKMAKETCLITAAVIHLLLNSFFSFPHHISAWRGLYFK